MKKNIIVLIILLSSVSFSQTLSFEEFLEIAKSSLNIQAIKELRSSFPKDFVVTALDIGDFSGDNKNDFAIAIKPHRSNRKINIYLFCDSLSHYTLVHADTLEFVELPIEIGFSISKEVCFITQKLKDKNWEITGYSFVHNELALVDHYDTDVKSIKKFQIGEEVYNNYKTLHSFIGYYDVATLGDYKKNNFIYHPVYERRRNLYDSYRRAATIDNTWKWDINDSDVTDIYGDINFSTENEKLIVDIRLNQKFLGTIDSSYQNSAKVFFDRAARRLDGITRRTPKFRESIDEDIASVELSFRTSDMDNARFDNKWGSNFSRSGSDEISSGYIKDKDLICRIRVPIKDLNMLKNQKEMGVFVKLDLRLKNGQKLSLANSNGIAEDPSSYGALIFLGDEEYYGSVNNNKFSDVIRKLDSNGLIKEDRP
ncbi:MAG: hypothetical protein ACM34K_21460 [Bacillota bacterium]